MQEKKSVEVPGTRWQQKRRQEFIETVLFWEGRINRSALMDRFGISEPRATEDLKTYMERAPNNISYDLKIKAYVVTPEYKPVAIEPTADRYLMQLRYMKTGLARQRDLFVTSVPSFDVMPIPHRAVEPEHLRKIVRAIHNRHSLLIRYQSMSSPDPADRFISPHSIAFDGYRWHARSFCHKDRTFKDFVIARMLSIEAGGAGEGNPDADLEWNTELVAKLRPNPKLTPTQRKVVAIDYGMTDEILEIKLRACFVYYFEKLVGRLTFGDDNDPANQQIEILNISQLKEDQQRLKHAFDHP